MKVSLTHLKKYVDIIVSVEELPALKLKAL